MSMTTRDIIVIGCSAGGVRALQALFSQLPADLPAAVFVVLHLSPHQPSMLSKIINGSGALRASPADDGEPIVSSRVYVAPPDRHLLIARGHIHLSAGPRENLARPAINPLFRSAALAYGPRVIGVVLTGQLDDGTSGLWEIKRRGGVAVVQEPDDADFQQMPSSALRNVQVDYVLPLNEIGPRLVSLVTQATEPDLDPQGSTMHSEETRLTCPECHGPLRRIRYGEAVELKCRVGHAYSPETALVAHDEAEERILWSAIEMLEEGADFAEILAESMPLARSQLRDKIVVKRRLAQRLRSEIETALPGPVLPEKTS